MLRIEPSLLDYDDGTTWLRGIFLWPNFLNEKAQIPSELFLRPKERPIKSTLINLADLKSFVTAIFILATHTRCPIFNSALRNALARICRLKSARLHFCSNLIGRNSSLQVRLNILYSFKPVISSGRKAWVNFAS